MQKESVNLEDLLAKVSQPEEKKRKKTIQENFFSKMTPEEIKEFHAQAGRKRAVILARKREEKAEMLKKAKELVPEMMAYDLAAEEYDRENWVPKQETIDKIKFLMTKNFTIEEMRVKFFSKLKDETWHKLMKYVFKSHVSQSEDLGAELVKAKDKSVKMIKARIRDIKKEVKEFRKGNPGKLVPTSLRALLAADENRLADLTMDYAKTLVQVGAVGEKSKSPSLHIHMGNVPRPEKKEKEVKNVG